MALKSRAPHSKRTPAKRTPKGRAPKRAPRQAPAKRTALRSSSGMVEVALAAFAHEVRTPLTGILAVTLDDAFQGVSDVVRGQDLFWSTSIHRLLQALLGLPEPVYHHHRLILDGGGRKLSKSTEAKSLRDLRAEGATAQDIRRMVGFGR